MSGAMGGATSASGRKLRGFSGSRGADWTKSAEDAGPPRPRYYSRAQERAMESEGGIGSHRPSVLVLLLIVLFLCLVEMQLVVFVKHSGNALKNGGNPAGDDGVSASGDRFPRCQFHFNSMMCSTGCCLNTYELNGKSKSSCRPCKRDQKLGYLRGADKNNSKSGREGKPELFPERPHKPLSKEEIESSKALAKEMLEDDDYFSQKLPQKKHLQDTAADVNSGGKQSVKAGKPAISHLSDSEIEKDFEMLSNILPDDTRAVSDSKTIPSVVSSNVASGNISANTRARARESESKPELDVEPKAPKRIKEDLKQEQNQAHEQNQHKNEHGLSNIYPKNPNRPGDGHITPKNTEPPRSEISGSMAPETSSPVTGKQTLKDPVQDKIVPGPSETEI